MSVKKVTFEQQLQRLEERGIAVSRRVLAKYREQMGLPPAYLRREAPGGEREKGPSSRQ